jgi:hypothetical protein
MSSIEITNTLRVKGSVIPTSRSELEELFPYKTFTTILSNEPPKTLPVLRHTDTEGYYCKKRAAIPMILEIEESEKISLEEALKKKISYFLERKGSIVHDGVSYISEDNSTIIESLIDAYELIVKDR